MRSFLVWSHHGASAPKPSASAVEPRAIASRVTARLQDLCASPPRVRARDVGVASFVWVDLDVERFRAPFLEEAQGEFAFASEYPLNARQLLRSHSLSPGPPERGEDLRAFARLLARHPESVLREAVPPFAIVSGTDGQCVQIANDGLGQAQLFEYDDGEIYCVTNRLSLLPKTA